LAASLVFPVRRLAADGLEAWKQVIERGYEGYVAKDEASAYEGGPTRRWLKVKQKGWTDSVDLAAADRHPVQGRGQDRGRLKASEPLPGADPRSCT
jgi:ATP-dependent DNA ligase